MHTREGSPSTPPSLPQNSGTQSSWDPSTVSNIVFGTIMVFVGIVAIWQGRHRRVVALDEELAIIRPLRSSMSLVNQRYTSHDAGNQVAAPQFILHDTSAASPSPTQLAIVNGVSDERSLPDADHGTNIPSISNRVTTLSTTGSADGSSVGLDCGAW